MAKLHFYYSAMNAGKSTMMLQSSYNYRERGMETILFLPQLDTRSPTGQVSSRLGLSAEAVSISRDENLFDYVSHHLREGRVLHCVLVDEAQFLSKEQVRQLCQITDICNIPVLAYGIRTDFIGEPFPGSLYLLAWADLLIEIKTICHCGRKATMNQRIDSQGNVVHIGEQVETGGNERYVVTCRQHFVFP